MIFSLLNMTVSIQKEEFQKNYISDSINQSRYIGQKLQINTLKNGKIILQLKQDQKALNLFFKTTHPNKYSIDKNQLTK